MTIRILLWILPSAASFGSLIPGFEKLFAFRLLAPLVIAILLTTKRKAIHGSVVLSRFRLLAAVWVFVAALGIWFGGEDGSGPGDVLAISLGLCLALAITSNQQEHWRNIASLHVGWVLAFLLTAAVALRELATGVHMPNYLLGPASLHTGDPRLIASVFGNPNAYGSFLILATVFLIRGLCGSRQLLVRSAFVGMLSLAALLIIASGSRISLLAFLVEIVTFVFVAGWRSIRYVLIGSMAIAIGWALIGPGQVIAARISGKSTGSTPLSLLDELLNGGGDSSGGRRLDLYLDGTWMVERSWGLGLGPGSFESVMRSGKAPYPAGGVLAPHNLYLEIASQYGLIVLVLLIVWLLTCLAQALRTIRHTDDNVKSWSVASVSGIFGASISSFANSFYLPGSSNWMFIATLLLVSVALELRRSSDASVSREAESGRYTSGAIRRLDLKGRM